MTNTKEYLKDAQNVIDLEIESLKTMRQRMDDNVAKACELIINTDGRVVVLGVGKSGHIANKIASTLASTGTPAFFVHPGEASHGDMGMITKHDVVVALSNSGETSEITTLIPLIEKIAVPLIAIIGNMDSTLARNAAVSLDASVEKEACPLNLAPTSSTTCALALGDALAVALLNARGFTPEDFAFSHPGGRLGRRLIMHVTDLMHTQDELPLISRDTPMKDAILEISEKRLGVTGVMHGDLLNGIITDGDVRRAIATNDDLASLMSEPCYKFMTKGPKVIRANVKAIEAKDIMHNFSITSLFVVDDNHSPIGLVHIQDLLSAGL